MKSAARAALASLNNNRCMQRAVRTITPDQFPGLALWLDASHVVETSGVVTRFTDRSGNNRHADATTGQEGTLVASAYGGQPGVSVTGGQRYSTPAFSVGTYTLFIVCKSSTNNTIIVEHGPNVNLTAGFWLYTGGLASLVWNISTGAHFRTKTVGTWGDGDYRIITQQFDGSVHELRGFGAAESTTTSGTVPANLTANGAQKLWIGGRADGTISSTATICEVIVYSGALTASQRAQVEAYLAAKYRTKLIPESTEIVTIGDSITAAWATGADAVTPMVLRASENPTQTRAVSLAVVNNTVQQQYAAWLASPYRGDSRVK